MWNHGVSFDIKEENAITEFIVEQEKIFPILPTDKNSMPAFSSTKLDVVKLSDYRGSMQTSHVVVNLIHQTSQAMKIEDNIYAFYNASQELSPIFATHLIRMKPTINDNTFHIRFSILFEILPCRDQQTPLTESKQKFATGGRI